MRMRIDLGQRRAEYDALIDEIRTCTDTAKRAELIIQAEDMLMETGALMPLFFNADIYLQKDYPDECIC